MKKFIAPQVRVIRYDNNLLCASRQDSGSIGDYTPGDGGNVSGNDDGGFYAPSRRIFGED